MRISRRPYPGWRFAGGGAPPKRILGRDGGVLVAHLVENDFLNALIVRADAGYRVGSLVR